MSSESLEQRARALLAAEYEAAGWHNSADAVRGNRMVDSQKINIRAIIAALESTPAREVELPAAIARIHSDGYWTTDDKRPDWKWPNKQDVFTADQLRAYGQACASARTAPAEGDVEWIEEIGTNGKPTGYWIREGSDTHKRYAAATAPVDEPVAEVGPAWSLVFVGAEPIAKICQRHPELRIGTKLYTRPAKAEPDQLLVKLQALAEKWREAAALANEHETDVGMGFEQCADELENTFHPARTVKAEGDEPEWVKSLRAEIANAAMKDVFRLSRDEVAYLFGGHLAMMAHDTARTVSRGDA